MLRRRPKSLVGLDIGSSAVKAVEFRRASDTVRLVAAGVEPLPPGAVTDGAIVDTGVVSDAIRRLLSRVATATKEVAISLSGHAVIVKKITLPPMSEEELRESIKWEARQHIPFDSNDVDLDYQVVNGSDGPDPGGDLDVLLVAAKKDKVREYTSVVSQAGCVPVVMDVDAFALQNAYELNYGVHPDQVHVLVNAGASAINLNVVQGTHSMFTRDLAIGGNTYTEAIRRELDLEFDRADLLKQGVTLDGLSNEDAEPVMRSVTQNLLQEVSKTLDFFRATAGTDRFDGILLTGGTSRVQGLAEALAARFDTAVDVFDPLRQVRIDPGRLGPDERAELGPVLAVAVGLALRQVGDR